MIRVIAGKYKGKQLRRVPSPDVRPMPQKLKETLFNIIQEKVPGSVFLDGFAGTGSVGIEALSRGARLSVFIEQGPPALKIIRSNLEKCQAEDGALVIDREFNRGIIHLAQDKVRFDLAVIDPPYRLLDERDPLKVIKKREVLNPKGIIVLRHHHKTKFKSGHFKLIRRLKRGDDILSFYGHG